MAAKPAHPRVALSNGSSIPAIGFGTWRCDVALLRGAVTHAIKVGYRHIDTGPYRNEALVGEGIRDAIEAGYCTREELWITGKLPTNAMDPDAVEPTLRALLKALGVEYVDLCAWVGWWGWGVALAGATRSPF